jgi:ABC-type thiamine transport system ATPase subunit
MDDYNLPSIYKQTMALAKTMVADNPKLSIDEALSKAGKQLGKQNKWETQLLAHCNRLLLTKMPFSGCATRPK